MVALPSEAPHGAVVASGSRFEMGMELVKRELTNGITGRQGEEVADVGRGLRNALGVVLRAPQQIIPSIANAGTKQRFELWRGGSFPDATTNAVGNVFRTARKGNIAGAASAVVTETLDPVIDEPLGFVGGAPYHVRASKN